MAKLRNSKYGIDSTFDAKEKYRDDLETWDIGNEHMCSIVLSTLPTSLDVSSVEYLHMAFKAM